MTQTVTAPDFTKDPTGWCLWYLTENAHIYRAFRRELDQRFHQYPEARVSADAALHHIRWQTPTGARGDLVKINNNASALFARLYVYERPHRKSNLELRRSFLDSLDAQSKWLLARAAEAIADEPVSLQQPMFQEAM